MLAKVYSCAVVGLDGVLVEVEVDVGLGKPGMVLVAVDSAQQDPLTVDLELGVLDGDAPEAELPRAAE